MEWISVKDLLPKPFVSVIVAGGVGYWNGSQWMTITGYQFPGQAIAWTVTHWMPFPESPTA